MGSTGKVSYRLNGGNIAALSGNCLELITRVLAFLKPDCPGWQSSMFFSIKTSSLPVRIICSLDFSLNFPSFQFFVFNFWAIYLSHLQKCHCASLHYAEGGKDLPHFSCCGKHGPGLLVIGDKTGWNCAVKERKLENVKKYWTSKECRKSSTCEIYLGTQNIATSFGPGSCSVHCET